MSEAAETTAPETTDPETAAPVTKYRKDYQGPAYLIDNVDMTFELHGSRTVVSTILDIRPNPAVSAGQPLRLDGEELELLELGLNGRILEADEYSVDSERLEIGAQSQPFQLRTRVQINPVKNTRLEGLYMSNGMFCTQCEANGFRRITYFLDRPDVLARFRVTLIGDREKYPVLLANGNAAQRWNVDAYRHAVTWIDPFPKPCYLFALVAGQLQAHSDQFITQSGRNVALEIWVEPRNIDKCSHAMESLKRSMRWDEQVYGLEYDLDIFMIVAVDHFNMGAMENKGLNIFNSQYILARPDTATDQDYLNIESVVAHEYFHNWTGNRVTCRDWFQLTLKEGLTVFRDQRFSADMNSAGVQRLQDVGRLFAQQFPEDAGPTAHPIRPESYIEMNNFYTATVYEKGAEVIRMLHTLLGAAGFRQGMDLYFERHDGGAVTCDDFVDAMADANGRDLDQFRRWYSQVGTPTLRVETEQQGSSRQLRVTVERPAHDSDQQQPLHLPLAIGLLDGKGVTLPVQVANVVSEADDQGTVVLEVTANEQSFTLERVPDDATLSLLRGYSAPVKLRVERDARESAFLLAHDNDPYSRWEAGQQLAVELLQGRVNALTDNAESVLQPGDYAPLQDAFAAILQQMNQEAESGSRTVLDPAFAAELLSLPTEEYLGMQQTTVCIDANHQARQEFRQALAMALLPLWQQTYLRYQQASAGLAGAGARRLRNLALSYWMTLGDDEAIAHCEQQLRADSMTDVIAALQAVVHSDNPLREEALASFYRRWQDEPQVIDKWFAVQAMSHRDDALECVKNLLQHSDYKTDRPNRVRALIGTFAMANPINFHRRDGAGYEFMGEQIALLDSLNPQLAARLITPLLRWQRFDAERQQLMQKQLRTLLAQPNVSKDLAELLNKSL